MRTKVDADRWANRDAWKELKRVRVVGDVLGLLALPTGGFVGLLAVG